MRINKFLATAGVASRRKCDELILDRQVKINGELVTNLGIQIDEKKDIVEYNGKVIKLTDNFYYYKLNKPKGYICTSKDDRNRKTVFELISIPNIRLFTIGRLDYNTEGLLLLTNNGEIAQILMHPSFEIEKEYHCTIKGDIKESELAVLRKGVVINNERLPKAKVEVLNKKLKELGKVNKTKLSVKIKQGINRQIRKMFEAIGKDIVLLKRVSIGEIKLGGLKRGEFKPLTENELAILNQYNAFNKNKPKY